MNGGVFHSIGKRSIFRQLQLTMIVDTLNGPGAV